MKHPIIDVILASIRDGWRFLGAVVPGVVFLASVVPPLLVNAAPAFDPNRLPAPTTGSIDFAREIKPLLDAHCVKCHGPEKAKNGFRLDTRAHALAGGDHGVDIIPGESALSPLVHFVAGLVPDMEMPPKGKASR